MNPECKIFITFTASNYVGIERITFKTIFGILNFYDDLPEQFTDKTHFQSPILWNSTTYTRNFCTKFDQNQPIVGSCRLRVFNHQDVMMGCYNFFNSRVVNLIYYNGI